MAKALADLPRLVTPKMAADYLGLSESQVRGLVATNKIARMPVGSRVMIPRDALDLFIIENTVQPCRDETQARVSASSKNTSAFTSFGAKVDAVGSAQRALQIANALKPRSPTSSTSARATTARVIPLKS